MPSDRYDYKYKKGYFCFSKNCINFLGNAKCVNILPKDGAHKIVRVRYPFEDFNNSNGIDEETYQNGWLKVS